MTPAAITIENLQIQRGGEARDPGPRRRGPGRRITGLLGPSGSGKSTLLRAIVGVQEVPAAASSCSGWRPARPAFAATSAT